MRRRHVKKSTKFETSKSETRITCKADGRTAIKQTYDVKTTSRKVK
jgi:hypothetical protein